MHRFGRRGLAAAAVATFALSSGFLISTAVAEPPTEDEIAAAREAEALTSASIAELEVQLAALAGQVEDATIRAQQANEAYLVAQDELEEATARSEEAQAAAATAQEEVEAQRGEIGRIAMSAYRSGPGALGPIEPLVSADSFENAMQRATATHRLGTRADETLQRFQATELVAETFQRRAAEAAAEQAAATADLADAFEEARTAADHAETQLTLSADRREGLIAQLAVQRGTTAELERERQEHLEAERIRRQEEIARAEAEAEARRQAEEEASRQAEDVRRREAASRDHERPSPATPRPAPSTAPAPSPSAAPSPSTRPTPAPTARPTPTPTQRPTPAPTQRPTPAPAPSPPPAPAPAPEPPPSSSNAARAALDWARTQLGKPYVWGAAGPNGYDCSGLTQTAFSRAGVSIPRTTGAQYAATTRVPVSDLQPGDLIFYSNNGSASGIYHVAFYAGNGMRLHAPSPGKNVELVPMYWTNVLPYGGRV